MITFIPSGTSYRSDLQPPPQPQPAPPPPFQPRTNPRPGSARQASPIRKRKLGVQSVIINMMIDRQKYLNEMLDRFSKLSAQGTPLFPFQKVDQKNYEKELAELEVQLRADKRKKSELEEPVSQSEAQSSVPATEVDYDDIIAGISDNLIDVINQIEELNARPEPLAEFEKKRFHILLQERQKLKSMIEVCYAEVAQASKNKAKVRLQTTLRNKPPAQKTAPTTIPAPPDSTIPTSTTEVRMKEDVATVPKKDEVPLSKPDPTLPVKPPQEKPKTGVKRKQPSTSTPELTPEELQKQEDRDYRREEKRFRREKELERKVDRGKKLDEDEKEEWALILKARAEKERKFVRNLSPEAKKLRQKFMRQNRAEERKANPSTSRSRGRRGRGRGRD